jgi:hypothetical protein
MKKIFTGIALFIFALHVSAQDDLLNMIEKETPKTSTPVYATFKSSRIINMQSNENMKAKHMDFRIQHRFGSVENGAYDFFGLDAAQMRLSFDYGITDKLMIGVGRNTMGKTYDGYLKYQLMQQKTKGKNSFPIGITYYGNMAVNTLTFSDPTRDNFFSSRLSYCNQIIFTRKFNDYFSFALSPTMVHHNLVSTGTNDIYALGIGASFKITRSTRFNVEYIPRLNGRNDIKDASGNAMYYDAFAFGFDIETGGHVFQLHFTNAQGLIEQQFITENTNKIAFNTLRFGFNLSRTFSFDKSGK